VPKAAAASSRSTTMRSSKASTSRSRGLDDRGGHILTALTTRPVRHRRLASPQADGAPPAVRPHEPARSEARAEAAAHDERGQPADQPPSTNPQYHGVVAYQGRRVLGRHEPLIDRDTFDRVQGLLARPSGGRRPPEQARALPARQSLLRQLRRQAALRAQHWKRRRIRVLLLHQPSESRRSRWMRGRPLLAGEDRPTARGALSHLALPPGFGRRSSTMSRRTAPNALSWLNAR
jgi:hypothetical protein